MNAALQLPTDTPCTHPRGHWPLWHIGVQVLVTGTPANTEIFTERTYCVKCVWCGEDRPESEAPPRDRRDEW